MPSARIRAGVAALTLSAIAASAIASSAAAQGRPASHAHFRRNLALGFLTSLAAHESAHLAAAYAVGSHPSFGFDKGRPTIYSNVDWRTHPRDQFIFSSAGMTVQMLLDEGVLDLPHRRGGAFERGILAGGIATVAFYTTIGRSASVSDVTFMARTSKLSITGVSLIYGSVAALHVLRIRHDHHYAHFFTAPDADGRLRVGVRVLPE